MVVRFSETISTAILLILLAVLILHMIRGDAMQWLTSKFTAHDPSATKNVVSVPKGTG